MKITRLPNQYLRTRDNDKRAIPRGRNSHALGTGKVFCTRGLDIFQLTPTKFLTQNEIDAAEAVRVAALNVQNQERIEWPRTLGVAKAYIDQLERSQVLPADQIAALRQAIQSAESSHLKQKELAKLKSLAPSLEKSAVTTKSAADSSRLQSLAEILKQPAR